MSSVLRRDEWRHKHEQLTKHKSHIQKLHSWKEKPPKDAKRAAGLVSIPKDRRGPGAAGSTYGLGFLQHCQDEDHIFLPRLQGSVLEVVVVFHVPQDEVRGQGAEAGSDVGLGEVQLPGMPQAPAPEPGDVLDELEGAEEHPETLERSSKESQTSPPRLATPWLL